MRKVIRLLLSGMALLLGPDGVHARRRGTDTTAPALAAVKSELRDPASARFEAIRAVGDAVCGTVEAKNELGADTGRMLFVYVKSVGRAYVLDYSADGNAALEAYEKYCQR